MNSVTEDYYFALKRYTNSLVSLFVKHLISSSAFYILNPINKYNMLVIKPAKLHMVIVFLHDQYDHLLMPSKK